MSGPPAPPEGLEALERAVDALERIAGQLERERWERRAPPRELAVHHDPAAGYDRLDRKQPKRLDVMVFARAVPGFMAHFPRTVPENFIAVDRDVLEVACPCGRAPRLTSLTVVECACGRVFARVGTTVHVAPAPEGNE